MGGRGSGGGRSGGGGGGMISSNKPPRLISFNDYYKEKYSQMTDLELNRAYASAQILMKKEKAKVEFEQNKLSKMVDEFRALPNDSPKLNEKWDAIDKQTSILNDAKVRADNRTQQYLLAVNEKYNIRSKHKSDDVKKMTIGQLDSFYKNSYKESNKAKKRIENSSNAKTKTKYQMIYDFHNNNFKKASAEKKRRNLGFGEDSKNW